MSPRKIKAILFDLDDTLYDEAEFFRSGFGAVGQYLEQRGIGQHQEIANMLLRLHQQGREQVFQKLAANCGFPVEWVPELVALFRSHTPRIALPPDTRAVLPRLRRTYRLGCVTDGWAAVQRRKIEALGIAALLDAIVVADELGREYWKPHTFPFLRCCELLAISPTEALFIGDNPSRDAAGAVNAAMGFVRMRRPGSYFERAVTDAPGCRVLGEAASLYDVELLLANEGTCESRIFNG